MFEKRLLSVGIAIVFAMNISFVLLANAADVTLAWDANTEPVTGYRVYAANFAQPFDYTTPMYEGASTSCTVTVADSIELKFVARAYLVGESGSVYESADSNQVQHALVTWPNPNLRVQ